MDGKVPEVKQRWWSVSWLGKCLPYGFMIWYYAKTFHSCLLYQDDKHEVILRQRSI